MGGYFVAVTILYVILAIGSPGNVHDVTPPPHNYWADMPVAAGQR